MEQDRWRQLEIELMKRRADAARIRIAELAMGFYEPIPPKPEDDVPPELEVPD